MHSLESIPTPAVISASGIVYKKTTGTYTVHMAGAPQRSVTCAISNKLRKELVFPIADPTSFRRRVMAVEDITTIDPVAVGDQVRFLLADDGGGLITEVLPRRNKLVRQAAGPKPLEQVIVANIDQVVFVFSAAHPAPKWNLLDRYLVSAEASELPALICISKLDAVDPAVQDAAELREAVEAYRNIGYRVILTSAITGEGIDTFKSALAGRASAFIGKSGVGKTTLLNRLEPGLGLRVNEVSRATDKGKHTTTQLEMFPLSGGGSVVDTPGLREFGLWQTNGGAGGIAHFFPEMRPYLGHCQFGTGCGHESEPGCAIKRAVEAGAVSERRYQSYLKLAGEQSHESGYR